MPVITRLRARLSHRNLLSLPPEILTQICRHVILNSSPSSHHLWFDELCDGSWHGLRKEVSRWWCPAYRPIPSDRLKHILFSRSKCPPLLLVNKHLYNEAVKYMSQDQVFQIGKDCDDCLGSFTHIVTKDYIPSSTIFDAGAIHVDEFEQIKATLRQELDEAYGSEVKLRIRKYGRTKQTSPDGP